METFRYEFSNRITYTTNRGVLHREDGPAIIYTNGEHWWFLDGLLHREDGPAVYGPSNEDEYFLNGVQFTALEHSDYQLKKQIELLINL